MKYKIDDVRIAEIKEVVPFDQVHREFPISVTGCQTTFRAREAIHGILSGSDERLLVVIGPCSIHDSDAALEYGSRLAIMQRELQEDLLIVMRVYFEKPRTTVGWKGLINDPNLDGSFEINRGVRLARKLLVDLNEMGIPAATEYLDILSPQYYSDLVSWGAIGARTVESQVHRELASGLSCPVGFKNATDGTLKNAIDALRAASIPHHFLSLNKSGHAAIFTTRGNPDCHIILRGGRRPNYDEENVAAAARQLQEYSLSPNIMIDFSHSNSGKQHEQQLLVAKDVAAQIAGGDSRIMGTMIESHLVPGRQDVIKGKSLVYGQSITDACIGWDDSVALLQELARAVAKRRARIGKGEACAPL